MNFFLPVRTNPKSGKRELNGGFLVMVAILASAFFFYTFLNKNETLVKKTVNLGGSEKTQTDQVYTEGGNIKEIEAHNAALKKIDENQTSTDPREAEKLKKEAKEKYDRERAMDARTAAMTEYEQRMEDFMKKNPTPQEVVQHIAIETETKEVYAGWVPFSVRKTQGEAKNSTSKSNNAVLAKTKEEKDIPKPTDPNTPASVVAHRSAVNFDSEDGEQNFLPLGTYIPAILLEDVITNDLQQYITVSVADDVTFRKRMQLPKGAVMLRGRVAAEPVQDVADIHFDVMIFADGTELPCSGVAYSALDLRYPDRFRTRGLPGELITPPLYLKAKALYYTAVAGGLESYLEDTNQNPNLGSGNITIQPPKGSGNYNDYFAQKKNPDYLKRAVLSGTLNTINVIKDDLQRDMERYRPYLKIEKGAPLFVQLEQTVNLSARTVNGLAKAQERERLTAAEGGAAYANSQIYYPPGDARANQDPLANPQVFSGNQPIMQLPSGLSRAGGPVDPIDAQIKQTQLNILNQAQTRLQSMEDLKRTNTAQPLPR